jgi:haloalkane dehalogenase
MGFGKSETPADRTYALPEHVENLEKLLLELDLRDITLVMQDIGGPIGAGFALRNPERVKRLFVMNTLLLFNLPGEAEALHEYMTQSPELQLVEKITKEGRLDEVIGNLDFTCLYLMKELAGFEAPIDPAAVRAYAAPFTTKEECLGAILTNREGLEAGLSPTAAYKTGGPEAVEALRQKPAMMAFGMRDRALPSEPFIRMFKEQYPGAPVIELEKAGHFLQEDVPDTLVALLELFIHYT